MGAADYWGEGDLNETAARQTQRINEAYQKLKSTTVQNRGE
jgi:curved DNA-binding protein CbpA